MDACWSIGEGCRSMAVDGGWFFFFFLLFFFLWRLWRLPREEGEACRRYNGYKSNRTEIHRIQGDDTGL